MSFGLPTTFSSTHSTHSMKNNQQQNANDLNHNNKENIKSLDKKTDQAHQMKRIGLNVDPSKNGLLTPKILKDLSLFYGGKLFGGKNLIHLLKQYSSLLNTPQKHSMNQLAKSLEHYSKNHSSLSQKEQSNIHKKLADSVLKNIQHAPFKPIKGTMDSLQLSMLKAIKKNPNGIINNTSVGVNRNQVFSASIAVIDQLLKKILQEESDRSLKKKNKKHKNIDPLGNHEISETLISDIRHLLQRPLFGENQAMRESKQNNNNNAVAQSTTRNVAPVAVSFSTSGTQDIMVQVAQLFQRFAASNAQLLETQAAEFEKNLMELEDLVNINTAIQNEINAAESAVPPETSINLQTMIDVNYQEGQVTLQQALEHYGFISTGVTTLPLDQARETQTAIDGRIDSINSTSQLTMFDLQSLIQKMSIGFQAASTVLKTWSDMMQRLVQAL